VDTIQSILVLIDDFLLGKQWFMIEKPGAVDMFFEQGKQNVDSVVGPFIK
jgi:hypothetical protein